MTHWKNRHTLIPAVFLIFRKDDNVLLLRRAGTGYMDGFYSLPAGHVDGGESAIVAACREAKEEVGVDIRPQDLRLVHVFHEKAEGHERMNLGFEVLHYQGKLRNAEPHKCDELRWSPIHEVPPNTVPSIKALLENVVGGVPYSSFNFN